MRKTTKQQGMTASEAISASRCGVAVVHLGDGREGLLYEVPTNAHDQRWVYEVDGQRGVERVERVADISVAWRAGADVNVRNWQPW